MRPATDSYDVQIRDLVIAVTQHGYEAGAEVATQLAYSARAVQRRTSLSVAKQAEVMRRDGFYCRYCVRKCIPSPIIELVHELYPTQVPWTPGWKGGATHPAFLTRSPCIDHVDPGAWSGKWNDADNLVTACFPCNEVKSDLPLDVLGWEVRDIPEEPWDGLVPYYRALWEAAGTAPPDPS